MANRFPIAARLNPKTTAGLKFSCSPNYESACEVVFNKLKISEKDIRGFQNIPNNRVAVKFIEKVFDVSIREYEDKKKLCYKCGRETHMAVNCNIDSEPKLNIFNLNDFPAMPGQDSDKGRISEEDGIHDVQLATGNEGNVEQPCDGKSIENDKEESSNPGEDQIDDLCDAVGETLVTVPSSKNVDDVAVHQHSVEIEGRSRDLEGHVPSNGDNVTDTDSDSDIFAIKRAPEGASQVTKITEDKGLPSQDEPRIPYTVESFFPVEDDVNEEPGNLKEINIAVSVHRDDESVDGATEERDMDVEVNKVRDNEDDLKNDDKGSDVMPKRQWNIDLDTVGKLKLIRGKSNKEKRKEEKMNG
ncbi:uncharacterized protein, partial [Palaemon carinicauda]|uniref:uncharacterized protein n=1 Tax=Palaemon carinicauda TaxID=392227 RepID=UPI0035B5C778